MDDAPAAPRRRPWLLALVVVVGLVAVVLGARGPLVTYWLARGIEQAADAQAEYEALCRANHWFHDGLAPGYSVQTFASDGSEIRPWVDGDYERVARVTLRWDGGREVTRELLSPRPLGCVFGE